MNHLSKITSILLSSISLLASCNKDDYNSGNNNPPLPNIEANVFKAAGDSLAIIGQINQFRSKLGDVLNTTPGQTSGRREVNWDGVPANLTNSNNFPFDFFNTTDPAGPNGRKRGLVYSNTGTSFRVDSTEFVEIDPSYAAEFDVFSKKRLFTYMGNNKSEITFRVPGTNTNASVKGFGLIFSDVDDGNYTSIQYFNGDKSLGEFKAPARTEAGGFSFLGVFFPNETVTRIVITSGNGVLATGVKDISAGGTKDLVVMDDFFFDEPKAIQ